MKLLVIDDERSIRNTLKEILEFEGHTVDVAEDGRAGLEMAMQKKYDAVFCDIKMPNMDGIEFLEKFSDASLEEPVIMISGHGTIDAAVECIKKGAYDFIQKPLDLNRILITLKNATEKSDLVKEKNLLKKKVKGVPEMVGESPAMMKVKEMIDRVAPTDARVLITGANGTGKELVAKWLHEKSERSGMPYVEVNCAAIPSELIESELFGHEKGACGPGKGAESASGAQAVEGRQRQGHRSQRTCHCRYKQGPEERDRERELQGRPLPPPQRDSNPGPFPVRAQGRHTSARRTLHSRHLGRSRQTSQENTRGSRKSPDVKTMDRKYN